MKTIDKASRSAHEAYDKIANATSNAAEALGEKGEQLQKAEQQLMKNCRGYISDNPITSVGYRGSGRLSAEPSVEPALDRQST